MASKHETTSAAGMGFLGWLLLLFIGLKLTGYINWSWWWVLGPIWIPIGVILLLVVCASIVMCVIDNK